MKDCQKVYIKGDPNRGAEVIKALTDLGAINLNNLDGKGKNTYYYISPLGIIIGVAHYEKNIMSILKVFYKEINLERISTERRSWKPKYKDCYYHISVIGDVIRGIWVNSQMDKLCREFGNCFRTKEEAEASRDKIKKMLRKC